MSEMKNKVARAKSYLKRIEQCDARINAMQDKLDSLYDQATRITPTLKQDIVSGGGNHDKVGDTVAKIVDLRNEINRQIDYYVDLQEEANALLNKLADNVHYTILYRRYMLGDSFATIAAEIGKGERWTNSLHGYALVAFADLLPEKYSSETGRAEKGQNGA
jgi:hypothetical protein